MHHLDLERHQLIAPDLEGLEQHHHTPGLSALSYLNPTASKSFSEILRNKLRSVLCVVHL
jgi:hypothetical protein